MTFAIIRTGGKQYKVSEGDTLKIEKLAHKEGDITFDEVLLVANDQDVKIGAPFVSGAKVSAKVLNEGKAEKKMVFRYKSKTRQHKKKGHRQPYTEVQVTKISLQ